MCGKGVSQDYREAVKWYEKAAEQGDASAQCNLGTVYNLGQGVSQDYKKAVKWFRKAAEQENAMAQAKLGVMFEDGRGVPQNYIRAYAWYNLATSHDAEYAELRDDLASTFMTPQQIASFPVKKCLAFFRQWQKISLFWLIEKHRLPGH